MSLGWILIILGVVFGLITLMGVFGNIQRERVGDKSGTDAFLVHMGYGYLMAVALTLLAIGIVVLYWYGGK